MHRQQHCQSRGIAGPSWAVSRDSILESLLLSIHIDIDIKYAITCEYKNVSF